MNQLFEHVIATISKNPIESRGGGGGCEPMTKCSVVHCLTPGPRRLDYTVPCNQCWTSDRWVAGSNAIGARFHQ